MKKNWYRRLLLSYIPIFFFVVTVLFIVFFISVFEMVHKEADKANGVFAQHVMQTLDYSLRTIDQLMIREVLTNEKFNFYFDPAHSGDSYLSYEVALNLKDLISTVPLVDSAYLYRTYDQMVLSGSVFISSDFYGDKTFIESYMSEKREYAWTDPRSFYEFTSDRSKSVVSLVKKVPLLTGSLGLVVINVSTESLEGLFQEMSASDISFLYLTDSRQQWIRGDMARADLGVFRPWEGKGQVVSTLVSELSGWQIHAGMKSGSFFSIFQVLSFSWVLFGIAGVAVGILLLIRVSRNHSRPVEAIMDRIQQFSQKRSFVWGGKEDEFRYIETAIDRLIEKSESLEEQAKESSLSLKKALFTEIMEGQRPIEQKVWRLEKLKLGWQLGVEDYNVVMIEIDKYMHFQKIYSAKDQYLLKFVLSNVLQEMAQEKGLPVWAEWFSNSQLGVLVQCEEDGTASLSDCLENLRGWVDVNLQFTVTLALGGTIHDISDAALSRDEAEHALKFKSTLGINRVIAYSELDQNLQNGIYEQPQISLQLAERFRLGDGAWRDSYQELADSMQSGLYERSEIVNSINYLLYLLNSELQKLSDEYRHLWITEARPEIFSMLESFYILKELTDGVFAVLNRLFEELQAARQRRDFYALAQEAKTYVDNNYANANLSLVHLSDHFHLTPTYLSRLFKDEIGEKMIDYLAKVRIEHAKQMLLETTEPIKDIAGHVGYIHAFSFIRLFKKIVGKTPGDFRKDQG